MTRNSKKLIVALMALLCATAVLLCGVTAFVIICEKRGEGGADKLLYERDFDCSGINSLQIHSVCGDICVKRSGGSEIGITAYGGEAEYFTVENAAGVITVTNRNSNQSRGAGAFSAGVKNGAYTYIEVYLPENCPKELEIKAEYGNVSFESAVNSNLTVKCNYGSMDASFLRGSFDIQTDCGNIEIGEIYITADSSVRTELGNIDIGITNEIRVEGATHLGNCDIENGNYDSGVTLKAQTSLGNIKINR